jgi:hypothetical protein
MDQAHLPSFLLLLLQVVLVTPVLAELVVLPLAVTVTLSPRQTLATIVS